MKRILIKICDWLMDFAIELSAGVLIFALTSSVNAQTITVSADSVKKQIELARGEYRALETRIEVLLKEIAERQEKIEQVKKRQVWLEGAANGFQAVLSDTTLRVKK